MAEGWLPQSWFARVTDTYNMLWKMVIRPPRDLYEQQELGPPKFRLGGRVYERRDLQLQGPRGLLECSHFVPSKSSRARRPCVVYLHGNCSSRLEAFDALPVLLPRGVAVFCLDLSGSGRSEGEYISLGHHEEQDLKAALEYLRGQPHVGPVGLWGRSMGACTSILRAAEDRELAACVLDSGFQDLRMVAEELVNRGRFPVPQFVLNWALDMIRAEVLSRARFDPLELAPVKRASSAVCPAFFGVAWDDSFVLPHHTQDLHDAWAGERSLRVFDGGHNGVRPMWFLEEAADFLAERLGVPPASASGVPKIPATQAEASAPTEAPQLDADVAAGPRSSPRLEGEVPPRKRAMAAELTKMGFGPDAVAAATRECSSVEEGLEWLLRQPQGVFCHVDNNHPKGQRDLGMPDLVPMANDEELPRESSIKLAAPEGEARARGPQAAAAPSASRGAPRASCEAAVPAPAADSAPAAASAPRSRRPPPPGSLQERLSRLGFRDQECEDASRRCLSLEAAMDFFQARQVEVHL